MAKSYVTEEGYNKMVEDLKQLEAIERPAISKQIAEARDKGDLSVFENVLRLTLT